MEKVKKISKYVMNGLAMINALLIELSPVWEWHLEKVTKTITIVMAVIGFYLVGGKLFSLIDDKKDEEEIEEL